MSNTRQETAARGQDPEQIVGHVIGGGYRVLGFLGQGGMGVIYLARQEVLQRDVILKVVRSDLADDDAHARFRREAHSLSLLSHPNVVQVYDHGLDQATGLWFIVMEYVRGVTLARYSKLRGQPLHVEEFAPIARQMVEGVSEAHRHQLIHRDIKLANVMLTSTDGARFVLKILDFGLSKLISSEEQLTQGHHFAGSAMYLAPEVMKNEPIDARVDVYALGVVFFKLLSGEDPIVGDNPYKILMGHANGVVRPLGSVLPANHQVPPGVIAMVDRCLATNPEQRPLDARELSALLDTALRGVQDDPSNAARAAAEAYEIGPPSQASFSRPTHPSTLSRMANVGNTQSNGRPAVAMWVAVSAGVLAIAVLLSTVVLLVGLLVYSTQQPTESAGRLPTQVVSSEQATGELLRKQALRAIQQGNYDEAVALTTQALEVAPEPGDLHELLAIVTDLRNSKMGTPKVIPAPEPAVASAPSPRPQPPRGVRAVSPPRAAPSPAPARAAPPQVIPPVDPVGTAVITSTPKGLSVEFAGIVGVTPFRATDVPEGTHEVVFLQEGTAVHTATIKIVAGRLELLDVDVPIEEEGSSEEAVADPAGSPPAAVLPPTPTPSTGPTEVYVFVPASVKSRVIQDALTSGLPQMNVTAFDSYRDFSGALRSTPPHVVLAPTSVLNASGLRVDLQGRDASGASSESYVVLSRDVVTLEDLGELTVGVVDLAGRTGSAAFVANRLELAVAPPIKRVPELADLLPLLQFGTADAVLLSEQAAATLKATTQMTLHELPAPSPTGLPAVAILDPARRQPVERAFGSLSSEASARVGVTSWSQ